MPEPTPFPSSPSPIDRVQSAAQDLLAAEEALRQAVRDARLQDVTWQQIADIFGVTRQAAAKRFGQEIAPDTQMPLTAPAQVDAGRIAAGAAELLARGKIDELRELMTQSCARSLGKRSLQAFHSDLVDTYGPLDEVLSASSHAPDGAPLGPGLVTMPAVGRAVARHHHARLVTHVTLNRAGRVTGLTTRTSEAETWPL